MNGTFLGCQADAEREFVTNTFTPAFSNGASTSQPTAQLTSDNRSAAAETKEGEERQAVGPLTHEGGERAESATDKVAEKPATQKEVEIKPATEVKTRSGSGKLSAEQLKEYDFARRSDGQGDDWVDLYRAEFPVEEQRDVEQLRKLLRTGKVVLHETRDQSGKLITWSMSQDYPAAADSNEPSFWLGCWTVTRRSAQSSGIGRVHFAKVLEALKAEKPEYIGRITEIESTDGLLPDSQPVRRAKFYKALGLEELVFDYEIPRFQPADATEYVLQQKLGSGIKGQLLIATFSDAAVSGSQVRSIVRRIYENGYHVSSDDPFIDTRLALIDAKRSNYRSQIRILAAEQLPPVADSNSNDGLKEQSTNRSTSTLK